MDGLLLLCEGVLNLDDGWWFSFPQQLLDIWAGFNDPLFSHPQLRLDGLPLCQGVLHLEGWWIFSFLFFLYLQCGTLGWVIIPFQKPQNSDLTSCQGVLKLDGEFFGFIFLTATLGLNYRYFFENLNSDFTSIHRSSRITQHWYVFGLQFSL